MNCGYSPCSCWQGHTHLVELEGIRDPHVAMHGSFSCMVNFCALQGYAEHTQNGFALISVSLAAIRPRMHVPGHLT